MFAFAFCSVMAKNNNLADKLTVNNNSIDITKQDIELPDVAVGYLTDPEGNMIALDCIDPKTAKKKHPKHVLKVYRLADKKLMWSKDYRPEDTQYKFLRQGVMEINPKITYITLLNKMDGTKIWKKDINFIGMLGDSLIACYGNAITAFNTNNCEKIWSCKMNTNYGITYCQPIDNKWNYLISDDLYRINLSTGDMLKLKSKTGIPDNNSAGFFAYMAFGRYGLIGYSSYMAAQSMRHDYNTEMHTNDRQLFMQPSTMVSGMHSNIVSKGGLNYYADYNSFMCFDDSLKLVYRTKIYNNKISTINTSIKESKSELIVKGDTAYVVSLGYGLYPQYGYKFNNFPHISSFNIKDGKALDNQRFGYDSVTVSSTYVNDSCIKVLFYNREAEYRFADRYITFGDRDTTQVGHFVCYLTDKMCYAKNDDNSFSEIKSTEEYTPVLTTRGFVANIKEYVPKIIAKKENIYLQIAHINDLYFYQGGKSNNELWCFNSDQATLVADDVKQIWQNNDKLEILTTTGKARIISLGK